MSTRQRFRALVPLRGFGPVSWACAVAAAVVLVLALAVLPVDADPTVPTPTPDGIVVAAGNVQAYVAPIETPTTTDGIDHRDLHLQIIPSPTPRLVRRPQPSPTAAATSTPQGPVLSDVQLIANRGFESRDAWYLEQGATIATGAAHRGEGFLLIDSTGGYADQRFAVEPGVTYRVAVWTRVSGIGASGARIGIRYEDGAYNLVSLLDPITIEANGQVWTKVVFTFTPPQGTARALITFWNPPGGTSLSIDDLSVRAYLED